MPFRSVVLVPALLVTVLILGGCAGTAGPPTTAQVGAASSGLVDATGAAVPVLGRDARVVDLGFLALDLIDLAVRPVAGYADSVREPLAAGLAGEPEAAQAVRGLAPALSPAFDVLVEPIVALDPDAVLTTSGYTDAFGPALDRLRAAGIPVVTLEDAAGWRDRAVFLGRLLDRGAEAERALARTEEALSSGRARLAGAGSGQAVVSVLRAGATEVGGDLEAYVPPSLPSRLVADLGLTQPAAQQLGGADGQPDGLARVPVSIERIAEHDGDAVVDLAVAGVTDASAVTGSPLWQRLAAVRNGRVVMASYLVWSVPSTVSVRVMTSDVVGVLT